MRMPGAPIDLPVEDINDFTSGGSATATGPVFSSTADAAEWLTTLITSAVPLVLDNSSIKALIPFGASGVAGIINAGTNNDSVSMQKNGEAFVINKKANIVWQARVATSAIAGTLLAVGLGSTGTAIMAAGGQSLSLTDFIGFVVRGTSGALLAVCKGASTETLPTMSNMPSGSAPALVNNTWTTLGFEVSYSPNDRRYRIDYFVDGNMVATHYSTTAALPLDSDQTTPIGLTQCYSQKTQASTANNGFIDYICCVQERVS